MTGFFHLGDRRIPFINPNGIFVTPFLFFAPGWINGTVTIARLKSEKFSLRKALRQENLTSGGEEMRKPMRPSTGAATLCSGLSRSVTARSCCTQQKTPYAQEAKGGRSSCWPLSLRRWHPWKSHARSFCSPQLPAPVLAGLGIDELALCARRQQSTRALTAGRAGARGRPWRREVERKPEARSARRLERAVPISAAPRARRMWQIRTRPQGRCCPPGHSTRRRHAAGNCSSTH